MKNKTTEAQPFDHIKEAMKKLLADMNDALQRAQHRNENARDASAELHRLEGLLNDMENLLYQAEDVMNELLNCAMA